MRPEELLGLTLAEAKCCLGERLAAVSASGLPRAWTIEEQQQLRVVRVKQGPTGYELTVVLPPVLWIGS
ncbi:MAG: hypothetical protein ACOX2K_02300 [Bacillota bacterium]|jgi:hypothetical protein